VRAGRRHSLGRRFHDALQSLGYGNVADVMKQVRQQTILNIGVTGGAKYTLTGFGITTGPLAPPGASNNNTSFAGVQATFFSGDNGTGTNLGTVATGPGNAVFSNHIDSTSPDIGGE
jgi:hypothetical protein